MDKQAMKEESIEEGMTGLRTLLPINLLALKIKAPLDIGGSSQNNWTFQLKTHIPQ